MLRLHVTSTSKEITLVGDHTTESDIYPMGIMPELRHSNNVWHSTKSYGWWRVISFAVTTAGCLTISDERILPFNVMIAVSRASSSNVLTKKLHSSSKTVFLTLNGAQRCALPGLKKYPLTAFCSSIGTKLKSKHPAPWRICSWHFPLGHHQSEKSLSSYYPFRVKLQFCLGVGISGSCERDKELLHGLETVILCWVRKYVFKTIRKLWPLTVYHHGQPFSTSRKPRNNIFSWACILYTHV